MRALIAYVPAIHAGYITLFKKHTDADLFVLGASFINAYPRLNRDLRAIQPNDVVTVVQSLGIHTNVDVLEIDGIDVLERYDEYILPDEDVSRDFAEKYLQGKKISLENIFLRWDGLVSEKEKEVPPDRVVSSEAVHKELMGKALTEAQKSPDWWRQIGAVLEKNDQILFTAHITYFPSDHALDIFGTPRSNVDAGQRPDLYISMHSEADIVAQAAKSGESLQGTNLYTTTFPCGNCARLIAHSGIKRVFYTDGYSTLDAEDILRAAGVEIILVK